MARYRIESSIVDTDKATWTANLTPVPAGYGDDRRMVCRSRKGRWYLVHDFSWSQDGCTLDYAEWISPQEAVRLLMEDNEELPNYPELTKAEADVCE